MGNWPGKNELKVRRRQEAENRAATERPLGEDFPSVESLSIQLDFVTPQRQTLDQETRVFQSTDAYRFDADCAGRCNGDGSFDLTLRIKQAVAARETSFQGSDLCQVKIYPGSSDVCGFQLQSKIEIAYRPPSA